MTRLIMKIGIGLLLTASLCGCRASSSESVSQPSPGGVVIGRVEQTRTGFPIDGHETMWVVTDKGVNDGISVGTMGYIRIHKAGMLEFRVLNVSDKSSELHGWYDATVTPGDRIIFNVKGLSDDELWDLSDALEGGGE